MAEHNSFRRKIIGKRELAEAIGPRPRDKKVIMCHGHFDLVHPGHIRHLLYAKSKASILIASLTGDVHITKGPNRPFVPEDLRAMNLAVLEFVDFVIIDENPTPLENLEFLQPDYFAKGYEYSSEGLPVKTREELEVIESYGGEIIFTPGDVVFSSSRILEDLHPNIAVEKLFSLMEGEKVTFELLRSSLASLGGVTVQVLGDTIIDSYSYCTLIGGGTKTPTLSLKHENQVDYVGGAGVVAKHLKAAGAEVTLATILGDDGLKEFVLDELNRFNVRCDPIIDRTRPTTQKNTFIVGGYRVIKVDKVDNRPISDRNLSLLKNILKASTADISVLSDFRHGIFNSRTIPELIGSLPEKTLKVADSQVASRWGNILDFQGFDLITPNEREARFSLGDQDSVVRPLGLELYKRANCRLLILKLGDRGTITFRDPSQEVRSFFTIDSFATRVVDPVGAGDALLAYSTLALFATKSEVIASILGSLAAAVACERDGNNTVSPNEVIEKLNSVEKATRYL